MERGELISYIDEKIREGGNYVVFSHYDVRVRHDVSKDKLEEFKEDAEEILEDRGYKAYFENDNYRYNGGIHVVQCSEIIVAIKQNKE